MRKILPFCAIALLFSFKSKSQASSPYTTCPNVSIAIARAGLNADVNNPYFLYNVNTITEALTLVPGGPYKDPLNPAKNLQVNAIGINSKDGYIYGINTDAVVTTNSTSNSFLRLDKNYKVTNLGTIALPVPPGYVGFINSAAGDMDLAGNYYFTAGYANISTGQLTNFFLGKISNVQSLTASTAALAVTWIEIDLAPSCIDYASTFRTDPINSGLKDFSYNSFTNTFFSYATYRPVGATNYSAQMLQLRPIVGSAPLMYEMVCTQVVNTHTAETSGTLIDNAGNFLVLLTDGTVGKIGSQIPFQFSGAWQALNNSTGLPSPLRGDFATCGGSASPILPVRLTSFTVSNKECNNTFTWTAENEVDFNHYELEQSTDNVNYKAVSTVPTRHSLAATTYKVTLPSAGKQISYRLKIIDNSGNFTYSRTLNVSDNCTSKFGFVVNPNPVLRRLNLNWYGVTSNAQVDVMIINANGSTVSRVTRMIPEGVSTLNIDVTNLPKGAYWIKATDINNNNSYQTQFIKQ